LNLEAERHRTEQAETKLLEICRIVEAITAMDYGITANDVDGMNWFDARDIALRAAKSVK